MKPYQVVSLMRTLAIELGGKLRISKNRGVPIVLKTIGGVTYSVCYFANSQKFRVFYPFPAKSEDQERIDFRSREAVLSYFNCES